MKKIIMVILSVLISLSITACSSNELGNEMKEKFDTFFENNEDKRYVIVTISKIEVSLGGPIGIEMESKGVIIAFDRNKDEVIEIKDEYYDSKGTKEHSQNYENYLFDFPFETNDINEYNEETESYLIEMKTNTFLKTYKEWFYICEMDQGADLLTGTKVVIFEPGGTEYEWYINRHIYSTGKVGSYPLYQTDVNVRYSDSLYN